MARMNFKLYSPEVMARHAEMLGNRVKKNFKTLSRTFFKDNVEAFRLYNLDIPEIRAVVDWYAGHVVLGEYVREQTDDESYLNQLSASVANALSIPLENVHVRRRTTRPVEGDRYGRLARTNERIEVAEGDLKFLVNLDDYLDTGLFSDHRVTRGIIRDLVKGKRFLNLFAYTGSFSVYAAKGGAKAITTVDMSRRYIDWAKDNMELNGLQTACLQDWSSTEVREYLDRASIMGNKWDVIFLDPPSYSTREGMEPFDILYDHRSLIESTLAVLERGGVLYFSTNHQRFEPDLEGLLGAVCTEVTALTLPIDYTGRTPHRLFQLVKNK
ncbi:MAG: class I SAM-dependent methyltransferase [Chitinophagaceae bacterium]|nr:class I SAM-dependent methyltransferase [Oligoflexus sp.]